MVTIAYFVGQIIPLEQLVALMAKFGVVALIVVVAAIALPMWLESRATQQPSEE